jgi:chromatin remodeling complex protein RSC6
MAPKKIKVTGEESVSSSTASLENEKKEVVEKVAEVVSEKSELTEEDVNVKITNTIDQILLFQTQLKEIVLNLKNIQKAYSKASKQKPKKNSSASGVKKAPSGFAKPTLLSDEICEFLNMDKGCMLARTEVTKHINQYIKKNNLIWLSL